MRISVQLFARAKELAGSSPIPLELPSGSTVADLKRALAAACPELHGLLPHLLVAVGTRYADDQALIPPGADVACFPPVSGG